MIATTSSSTGLSTGSTPLNNQEKESAPILLVVGIDKLYYTNIYMHTITIDATIFIDVEPYLLWPYPYIHNPGSVYFLRIVSRIAFILFQGIKSTSVFFHTSWWDKYRICI